MEGMVFKVVDIAKFERLCETVERINQSVNQIIDKQQDEHITPDQFASELGVTKQTIYNYIKSGKVKAKRIGRKYFIRRKCLNEALKDVKSLKYKR
jgi:excisionase family DNA binding protein